MRFCRAPGQICPNLTATHSLSLSGVPFIYFSITILSFNLVFIFLSPSLFFPLVSERIMPSLSSIEGLGEKAADAIVEAVKDGSFLSKDGLLSVKKNGHCNYQ